MDPVVSQQNAHHLPWLQRISYSVGHAFNDLCASFWFTYLLVFMNHVNGFSSDTAGTLMLIGQVADGMATVFIGIECDKVFDWWICRYGRRKSWHLVGTICVFFSFPFLFNQCVGCQDSSEKSQIIYYAAFIILFQFGWAAVQISHLSLIPDLTPVSSERVELNAYRYAFTVFSNITVYLLMLAVLALNQKGSGDEQINSSDAVSFREVAFIIIILGAVFSILFHLGVREKRPNVNGHIPRNESADFDSDLVEYKHKPLTWKKWFTQAQFYQVALLYMGTRLTINLTQVYVPNYLQESLYLPKKSVAYIPLVIYTSGFLSSFVMKYINVKFGKRPTYLIGAAMSLIASVCIYFGSGETYKQYGIFGVSIILGVSSTTMLITSLAITSDLIGQNTASGAFVFGAMSFVDKFSNGLAVMVIEDLKPCKTCTCLYCDYYYQNVLTFVCGSATAISIIALALLSTRKIGIEVSDEQPAQSQPSTSYEQPSLSSPLLDDYDDSS